MFIIKQYDDGSCSYGYEVGDEVLLTRDIQIRPLRGTVYASYKKGDKVTITARGGNSITMIPDILSLYRFNGYWESYLCCFEPAGLDQLKPPPSVYVVPWYEGRNQKYSLVSARSPGEATKVCFSAPHFTKQRMEVIKIGKVFEKGDWQLPEGKQWISIHPLR